MKPEAAADKAFKRIEEIFAKIQNRVGPRTDRKQVVKYYQCIRYSRGSGSNQSRNLARPFSFPSSATAGTRDLVTCSWVPAFAGRRIGPSAEFPDRLWTPAFAGGRGYLREIPDHVEAEGASSIVRLRRRRRTINTGRMRAATRASWGGTEMTTLSRRRCFAAAGRGLRPGHPASLCCQCGGHRPLIMSWLRRRVPHISGQVVPPHWQP